MQYLNGTRSEVLTAVWLLHIAVFWDVILRHWVVPRFCKGTVVFQNIGNYLHKRTSHPRTGFKASKIWHRVIWRVIPDILMDHSAFTFRIKHPDPEDVTQFLDEGLPAFEAINHPEHFSPQQLHHKNLQSHILKHQLPLWFHKWFNHILWSAAKWNHHGVVYSVPIQSSFFQSLCYSFTCMEPLHALQQKTHSNSIHHKILSITENNSMKTCCEVEV